MTEANRQEQAEAAGSDEEKAHPRYMLVFLWLFILTALEIGVAFVSALPKSVIVVMLIALAIWKALLVALYYMHLRFEPKRLRIVVLAPLPVAVIMVVTILMEYV